MPATTPSARVCAIRPERVVDAYDELYRGYRECPVDVLERTFSEIGTL